MFARFFFLSETLKYFSVSLSAVFVLFSVSKDFFECPSVSWCVAKCLWSVVSVCFQVCLDCVFLCCKCFYMFSVVYSVFDMGC